MKMKSLKNILIYTTLILSVIVSPPEPATAQERPLVLAFYYAWFDQNTWTSGQSVDLPAEPYSSADRATIERHVAQAQGAGINAFVQSWYGPQEANNQTETNFRTLLEVAAATGFRAAVDVEVSGPFFGDAGAVTNALTTLLTTHAQHPGYLRYQGKPVIFFWRQQRFSVEQWIAMRNQVDPNRDTYWIAEGTDLSYQAIFDGHHLYSIAWSGTPANELAKWGDRMRAYEADNGVDRLWVATVMPGYNDTLLPRENAFAVPRRNGDYYRETWQGAVASGAEMLLINSFNEWPEGTHIEPSASYGNAYLDITRDLVSSLGGSPPPQTDSRAAAIPAAQEAPPDEEAEDDSGDAEQTGDTETALDEAAADLVTPEEPFVRIGGLVNVRSGPSTDFEQVGQLTIGDTAPVVGQAAAGDWWQIEFPAGEDGLAWVAAAVVEFVGDQTTVAVVDPAAEPTVELPTLTAPPGGITVRARPDREAESLGRLTAGDSTTVTGQDETGDWWQIAYQDGDENEGENGTVGWVATALVDLEGESAEVPVIVLTDEEDLFPTSTPTPTPLVVAGRIVSDDAINVRAEPSVDGTLVGGLYLGDRADVYAVSEDGDWWQIEFPDAPDGLAWVAAEFVRFQGNEANVPIYGLGTPTPTPGPTDTPTPIRSTATPIQFPPTFAPTATSPYQGTAAALLEERGTPDPSLSDAAESRPTSLNWGNLPWGLISIILIGAFVWYQWRRQPS